MSIPERVPEFEIEFYSPLSHLDEEARNETEERLRKLATGHWDITGASVAAEDVAPHEYRARVVVYMRPENIAAEEKGDSAQTALRSAIRAVERQVRSQRERMREHRRRS